MLACRGPHERERRDVRDRQQQHQPHGAGKQSDLTGRRPDDRFEQRHRRQAGLAVLKSSSPEREDAHADFREVAGGLRERDAGFESGDATIAERSAPAGRGELQDRPHDGGKAGQVVAPGLEHTDDRVAHSLDRYHLTHGGGGAAERALGEGM